MPEEIPKEWQKTLSIANSLVSQGMSHEEATFIAGLSVSDKLLKVFEGFFKSLEKPEICQKENSDISEIQEALDVKIKVAKKLVHTFKCEENPDISLACLLLVVFDSFSHEKKSNYGVNKATDEIWVRTHLKRCRKELLRQPTDQIESKPEKQKTRDGSSRQIGNLQDPLLINMINLAYEPISLPSLDHNIEAIFSAARRKRRRCIALLSSAGMGKTFTMQQLAARLKIGDVPKDFKNTSMFQVSRSATISSVVGQTARMLNKIFEKVQALPRTLLFFDEFQGMVSTGHEGHQAETTSEIKELFSSDRYPTVTVVIATTKKEFDIHIRTDPALERRFTPIHIAHPKGDEEIDAVLLQGRTYFEDETLLTREIVNHSLRLAREYFPSRSTIDCSLDLMDGAYALFKHDGGKIPISECINQECRRQTSMYSDIRGHQKNVNKLFRSLKANVVGQHHVIHQVVEGYRHALLGLGLDRGPQNVILFIGPPGVGKTHIARTYAKSVDAVNFLHLHMGEYSNKNDGLDKLIGAGPSFKGSEVGGVLVNTVRDRPETVILFDEIDQASDEIRDLLLRIMDEGVILDGFGNLINFRKATIFLTTNKGEFLDGKSKPLGFTVAPSTGTALSELKREEILESMKNIFSGAFRSRIRMASVFEPLSYVELADIAELKIKEQARKIRENTGLDLKSGPHVGDLFVAFTRVSEDARQIENVLREHLWPRLTQVFLDHSVKQTGLHILYIQVVLPGTDRALKIFLLDDKAEEVVNRIQQDLIQVTPCSNPQFGAEQVLSHDVVLLDLDWGHGSEDGIKLLKKIRTYSSGIPVLLYTDYSDHELRTSFFKAGASGFVPKDDPELLKSSLDRIRRDFLLRNLKNNCFERIDWDVLREDESLIVTLSLVKES